MFCLEVIDPSPLLAGTAEIQNRDCRVRILRCEVDRCSGSVDSAVLTRDGQDAENERIMLCPGCSLAIFAEVLAEDGSKRDVQIGNGTPCIENGNTGLDVLISPSFGPPVELWLDKGGSDPGIPHEHTGSRIPCYLTSTRSQRGCEFEISKPGGAPAASASSDLYDRIRQPMVQPPVLIPCQRHDL